MRSLWKYVPSFYVFAHCNWCRKWWAYEVMSWGVTWKPFGSYRCFPLVIFRPSAQELMFPWQLAVTSSYTMSVHWFPYHVCVPDTQMKSQVFSLMSEEIIEVGPGNSSRCYWIRFWADLYSITVMLHQWQGNISRQTIYFSINSLVKYPSKTIFKLDIIGFCEEKLP